MKKYILLLILLFSTSNITAQNETPYQKGEFFKFKISYSNFLSAGYATLELTESTYENKTVYLAKGYGANSGLSRIFFKVEDHYHSYFDKETGVPYLAIRNIAEGSYKRHQKAYFNYTTNEVLVKDIDRKTEKNIKTTPNIQDVVSTFYYLRNNPKIDYLKNGETIDVDMFFDDEIIKFKLKFTGKEIIKTKFGKIQALTFKPMVQSGRVFKEEESLTIWISDDKNKAPLLIKADLAVGSINAELHQYSGLKHPLNKK
ncbi:MAG: DUF3108 domain-containing protein [Bacteroidota bacterium]|nr:DUF3108 domain-containing protein [Bacteroidota bacterium]